MLGCVAVNPPLVCVRSLESVTACPQRGQYKNGCASANPQKPQNVCAPCGEDGVIRCAPFHEDGSGWCLLQKTLHHRREPAKHPLYFYTSRLLLQSQLAG